MFINVHHGEYTIFHLIAMLGCELSSHSLFFAEAHSIINVKIINDAIPWVCHDNKKAV